MQRSTSSKILLLFLYIGMQCYVLLITSLHFSCIWKAFWIQTQRYQIYWNWNTHSRFIEDPNFGIMTSSWCPIKGVGGPGSKNKLGLYKIVNLHEFTAFYRLLISFSVLEICFAEVGAFWPKITQNCICPIHSYLKNHAQNEHKMTIFDPV